MNNEIVINIKKSEFYHHFNNTELSKEVAEYLLDKTGDVRFKQVCHIKINVLDKITEAEKEKMVDTIRKHFGLQVRSGLVFTDIETTRMIILFLIGVIFLILSYLIQADLELLSEIFLIVGWVGIWESIYRFIFDNVKMKINVKRNKYIANANITIKGVKDEK